MVRHLNKLEVARPVDFVKEAIVLEKEQDHERALKAHELALTLSEGPRTAKLW